MKYLNIFLLPSLISILLLFHFRLYASEDKQVKYYPKNLIKLDNMFSHHVIIAEKSTHKLYLYKNQNHLPELIKTYSMATGKKAGNKLFQGDHRTPEGIYTFTQFLTHQDLIKKHGKQGEIYGVGAFVLNYPNPIDTKLGKTGGGIWLHSTNDETRIDKGLDSRGCIVTANKDIIDISRYIELYRTPVIVVHELEYIPEKLAIKKAKELTSKLENWLNSWREEDIDHYLKHYHKNFYDKYRGNLRSFSKYKKTVFKNPGLPKIQLRNISILSTGNYLTITFEQSYRSKNITDIGKKVLYLEKNEFYEWKITSEQWSKKGISNNLKKIASFKPSQRFFEETDPYSIMGDRLTNSSRSYTVGSKEESKN